MINNLVIILSLILAVSITVTFFSVWYSIRVSKTLIYFSENINDLLDTLANYSKHVKSVYGLESFYGDQVLHKLLKHSQEIVEQIETFDEILYLTEEEGELMNEQEEQFDQYDTDSTDSREDAKEAPPNPKRIRGSF